MKAQNQNQAKNFLKSEKTFTKASEQTPNYDTKSTDANKYVEGGATVFIPDLCEDLKEDWYPKASYEEIKKTDYIRNEFKHKVMEDWAIDKDKSGKGVWWPQLISMLWPWWLESEKMTMTRAYRQYRSFMADVDKTARKTILDVPKKTPDPPSKEEEKEKPGVKHRRILDTPEAIYDDVMDAIGEIWERLFDYGGGPGPDVDIDSTVVAPSDKYRLRLLKGLGPAERKALINQIEHMNVACIGFLKHARDVLAQEARVDK